MEASTHLTRALQMINVGSIQRVEAIAFNHLPDQSIWSDVGHVSVGRIDMGEVRLLKMQRSASLQRQRGGKGEGRVMPGWV